MATSMHFEGGLKHEITDSQRMTNSSDPKAEKCCHLISATLMQRSLRCQVLACFVGTKRSH